VLHLPTRVEPNVETPIKLNAKKYEENASTCYIEVQKGKNKKRMRQFILSKGGNSL